MSNHRGFYLAAAFIFFWFAAAVLFNAFQEPLVYDDAYNAAVARNIAEGKGWVTDYHATIPFNSTVTSGPSLLLPAAMLIKIFGVQLWIPPTTNALLMLAALLLAGVVLSRLLDSSAQFLAVTVATLAFFSLYTLRVWSEFAGDGFIAMSIIAASALIACALEQRLNAWAAVAAGALLALALLSKLYGLISALGVLAAVFWHLGRAWLRRPLLSLGRTPGLMAVGAASILLPWFIYKSSVMGALPAHIRDQRAAFADEFFRRYGSGVEGLTSADDLLAHICMGIQRNFYGLAQSFELQKPWAELLLLALVCIPLMAGLVLAFRREVTKGYLLIFLLVGAASAHWFWYIALSPGDVRYALIPILLSCCVIALLFSMRFRGALAIVVVAVIAAFVPPVKQGGFFEFAFFRSDSSTVLEAQKSFIRAASLGSSSEPLIGCSWAVSRLLDYAAPGDAQLKDLALILKDVVTDTIEDNMPSRAIELSQPIFARLATSGAEWGFGRYIGACPIPDYVESMCVQPLFSEGPYFVKRCSIHHIPIEVVEALRKSSFHHLSGML